ncbi:MAG TPA: universal stress protein [Blastocatellia bacterium]|nr:universal stress protein [Blastocatellia bacterium]HMX29244.1 universal stress protein [Blastocatellia bacterium]HMY75039.1 universal stress protein [Blastocatellia bacterium]HMZ22467.1 universal stress protein [Blastocatellia bacterium]HNG29914.1 universal stress protein [Blastocatellia bacterium]
MANRMKVLIAYDGSECANDALDDLNWAGLPAEVDCKVLSVLESWLPPPSGLAIVEHIDHRQEFMTLAAQAARRVTLAHPAWEVSAEIGVGSPASVILEKADEWNPDLIVLGAHGRSALGRLVFGSVSQKVLHEATGSVRIARERAAESERAAGPAKLLLGFDGSPSAKESVRIVTGRHWPNGCEIRLVYGAWPNPGFDFEPGVGQIADWIAEEDLRIKTWIEAEARDLRAAGFQASTIIKAEEPKRLLLDEAESWKPDCIFVGARGLGRLERLRLGSVSSAVAARAHCSVEVVRA